MTLIRASIAVVVASWSSGEGTATAGGSDLLLGLPAAHVPQWSIGRHAVGEQDTVEVVDLVLEDAGQPILGVDGAAFAGQVEPLHAYANGALDVAVQRRQAEAALLAQGGLGRLSRQHGIEQDVLALLVADDDQTLGDPDLGRRQAHAGRLIHRLKHIRGQLADGAVDAPNRSRFAPEHWGGPGIA